MGRRDSVPLSTRFSNGARGRLRALSGIEGHATARTMDAVPCLTNAVASIEIKIFGLKTKVCLKSGNPKLRYLTDIQS
jgi:hypothetical protein